AQGDGEEARDLARRRAPRARRSAAPARPLPEERQRGARAQGEGHPDVVSAFHALIPAAGRGVRAGGALPKQLREVAGRPLVAWAVARVRAAGGAAVGGAGARVRAGGVASCVVAAPADLIGAVTAAVGGETNVRVVVGGATRQESVA